MTRNWTDYPLTVVIPRKKIHITELYQAYEERLRFLRADSNRTTTAFPLPVFYYDKPNAKLWGDDYPKADPAHWPPNESPDNKVRNDHIYNIRYCVPGAISSTASDGAERPDRVYYSAYSYSFVGNFIKPDDAYYRPYDAGNNVGFQPFQDALSQADYTDTILTAGSTYVKAVHIDEVRKMMELFSTIYVEPNKVWVRYKQGSGGNADEDTAWSAAVSDFDDNDWSDWFLVVPEPEEDWPLWWNNEMAWQNGGYEDQLFAGPIVYGKIAKSSEYSAYVAAQEVKVEFDFDLEIYHVTDWPHYIFPPVSAKLCIASYSSFESDTNAGWDAGPTGCPYGVSEVWDENVTFYLKCDTTGESSANLSAETPVSISAINGPIWDATQDARKGYVIDSDISSYMGTSDATFAFVPKGSYSDAFDEIRPPTPSASYPDAGYTEERYVRGIYTPIGTYNRAGLVYAVIQPDWIYPPT